MNDVQRLKEMGIPVWGLRRPELFPNAALNTLTLPDTCKLLFVSDVTPNEHDAWLFGKILASMQLTPDQALRLPREALSNLKSHSLEWCWFAGVDAITMAGVKQLTSPSLSLLQDNPDAKKTLWVQIRQYER